jgi:hypothetical protein
MPTYECPTMKNNLKAVRQYKGEMLRQYIQHFSQMRIKIPRISNEEIIYVFFAGVTDIKMKKKLSMNDELTSMVRLFEIADRCAKAEEGRLFVHSLLEAPLPKSKPKDPKRKEVVVLAAEPEQKHRREDRSERDKSGCRGFVNRSAIEVGVWWFVEGGEHGRAIRDGGSTSLPSFRSRNGGETLRAAIIHYMATSALLQ